MAAREGDKDKLEEVLRTLSGLKGVKHAFYLSEDIRKGLREIEKKYPSIGPLTVQNEGIREALKRSHVACIIKDKGFRAPPHATVQLVNDDGVVIGREILPGERFEPDGKGKHVFLGKDFVVFADRSSGKGARFLLPPIPFKEVASIGGVTNVCSSSPSTVGDMFVRKGTGLKDDPKLASILIGFDLR
ncbi:MAG TPA: hypothetical protein VF374_06725 [Thermoplasmata archaeon]|jgi:hypothetical protein